MGSHKKCLSEGLLTTYAFMENLKKLYQNYHQIFLLNNSSETVIDNRKINGKYPGPSCAKRRYLNELVKGHFVNCFSGFIIQYSDIFC